MLTNQIAQVPQLWLLYNLSLPEVLFGLLQEIKVKFLHSNSLFLKTQDNFWDVKQNSELSQGWKFKLTFDNSM